MFYATENIKYQQIEIIEVLGSCLYFYIELFIVVNIYTSNMKWEKICSSVHTISFSFGSNIFAHFAGLWVCDITHLLSSIKPEDDWWIGRVKCPYKEWWDTAK